MASRSTILACRTPQTGEPAEPHGQGSLQNPTGRGACRTPRTGEPAEPHGQGSLQNPTDRGACRTPRTEEPGGLQSMGSHRIGQDGSNLAHKHARVIRKLAFLLCSPPHADSVKREADCLQQGASGLSPNTESAGCWILDVYFQNYEK